MSSYDSMDYAEAILPDKPELKPCPFCGGKAEIRHGIVVGNRPALRYVNCMGCDIGTKYGSPDTVLIAAWNRRAPRFSPEEREALQSVIDGFVPELYVATIRKMLEEK